MGNTALSGFLGKMLKSGWTGCRDKEIEPSDSRPGCLKGVYPRDLVTEEKAKLWEGKGCRAFRGLGFRHSGRGLEPKSVLTEDTS